MTQLFDRAEFGGSRMTQDGYLVASARVARTGIQKYTAKEVGKDGDKIYSVYRPPEEVFAKDSMQSYAHKPLTNDHPPEMVTPDNFKKYSVGHLDTEVGRETVESGDFVRVSLIAMDAGAIKQVEDGKKELSMGYTCDLDFTAGVTPEGEQYDAIQRNLRMNHLAIVTKARGGSSLKIGDNHKQKEFEMSNHADFVLDGVTFTAATSKDAANIKTFADNQKSELDRLKAENDKLRGERDQLKKDKQAKDGEIAVLTKSVADNAIDDAKIEAFIKARDAKKAVAGFLGDSAVAEMSDAAITAAHATLVKSGKLDGLAASSQGVPAQMGDAWSQIVAERGGK